MLVTIHAQPSEAIALTSVGNGEVRTVAGFEQEHLASKLMAMGVLPGSQIKIIRRAPFGGACYVAIDQHYLALRHHEAAAILIK